MDALTLRDSNAIELNQRVIVDGARGTVRYVGPVATSKTEGAVYAGEFLRTRSNHFAGLRCVVLDILTLPLPSPLPQASNGMTHFAAKTTALS